MTSNYCGQCKRTHPSRAARTGETNRKAAIYGKHPDGAPSLPICFENRASSHDLPRINVAYIKEVDKHTVLEPGLVCAISPRNNDTRTRAWNADTNIYTAFPSFHSTLTECWTKSSRDCYGDIFVRAQYIIVPLPNLSLERLYSRTESGVFVPGYVTGH